MAVLTWRDVASPDASQALYGLSNAGKGISDTFSNLAQGLKDYQTTQEDSANAAGLTKAMQYQNPDDLRAAIASGAFSTNGMNAAGIQALNSQVASQIDQRLKNTQADAAQHELDQTLNDENFQKAHPDLMATYQSAMMSGDPNRISSATSQLSAAGAGWNMLQTAGKNSGAMGQQAAAIRSSNASAAEAGARMGLIGAQTKEIEDNIGLKGKTAALGLQIAQANAVSPNGGLGVLASYAQNGGNMRAAAPFISGMIAQAGARTATPSIASMGGGASKGNASGGFPSTGQTDIDSYLAKAIGKVQGQNPNADMGTLQTAQDNKQDWSKLAPTIAKNMGVNVTDLNPVRDRIKAYVKQNTGVNLSDAAVGEIISRRTRSPSILHPSEWLDMSNDFPKNGGLVVDRDGVLADANNLKPGDDGLSPGTKALTASQQTQSAMADLGDLAQRAAAARQERIRLLALQGSQPSNPYVAAQLAKAAQLENAYTNSLKSFGSTAKK